jgi:rod shape-determining protein MreC
MMKPGNKLKWGAVLIVLIALFVLINLTGFSSSIRNFFYSISAPVQASLWKAGDGARGFFDAITNLKNLESENENLKAENLGLLAEKAALLQLSSENQSLREALGIKLNEGFQLVGADTISKDASEDIILVNKGSEEGMAEGFPAITSQKVLIGRITEVYKHYSKITLITNKDSSFDAKIDDTGATGMVKGQGSSKASLELIPREIDIKEGDQIMTTSLGDIFPDGLFAGQIKSVSKSDLEAFQKAEISPGFEIKNLGNIFIIVNF